MSHTTIVKTSPNYAWADRLRNIATVLVITIHTAGSVAQGNTEYDSWYWWSANWWDSLSRPSVPMFIMLSGFLLLGKDYPLGDFLKKRFSRVVLPALFWFVVFSLYNHIANGQPATFREAFLRVLERDVHYHLWFIYLIIGLYLLYPLLRPWVKSARDQDYWYFFAVCAFAAWFYKIFSVFFHINIGLYLELFGNHAGTFVLGYYLGHKLPKDDPAADPEALIKPWPLTRRQLIWLAAGLIIVGTVVTAVGTWWASKANGQVFHLYFYDYLTPNVGLAAAGWFMFAQLALRQPSLLDFERDFAAASFGIYFVHVLALDWFSRCGYWSYKFHPSWCIPVIVVMVSLMSFVWISLLRAAPGGQKVT